MAFGTEFIINVQEPYSLLCFCNVTEKEQNTYLKKNIKNGINLL